MRRSSFLELRKLAPGDTSPVVLTGPRTLPGASWRSAPFRVYWRFGKPRGGVSACAPLAVPALLIAGPLIPVASAISTQDESIKRNAAPQRLWRSEEHTSELQSLR